MFEDLLSQGGLISQVTDFGLKVVGVIALFIVARIVAGRAKNAIVRGLTKRDFDQTLTKFFGNVMYGLILLLSVIAILGIFGIQTASFAAVIGAAGLAIGLAFQGTLGNFAAGIMLLIFRPFGVGDVIKVSGEVGKVEEIDLFITKLDTVDNRRVVIPNGQIFGGTIETITFHPTRRVDVAVGTDYGADLDACRRVLNEAIQKTDKILEEPAPTVFLDNLGDSSINWSVRAWCETGDFFAVREQLTYHVKTSLDAAGIGIPFPQMDVHLDGRLDR
ncbi:MAG: mechanosensitive ion channel domain-containing protein [Bacteroidota bacterium]